MQVGLIPDIQKIVNENTHPNDSSNWHLLFMQMRDLINKGHPIVEKSVVAADGISFEPTVQSSVIRVISSTAGNITVTKNPQIAAGNDGQELIFEGTNDTRSVTLTNGNGLQTAGHANMELRNGDIISFMYNKGRNLWIEKYRSINR